jgi:hypothetical protein
MLDVDSISKTELLFMLFDSHQNKVFSVAAFESFHLSAFDEDHRENAVSE